MKTEMGEYAVGAYLKLIKKCDVVDYNARSDVGGLEGLSEFDVVGYNFKDREAYLCEVATHILGLNYGSSEISLKKIAEKHKRQKRYAESHLTQFSTIHYQLWSPKVAVGLLSKLSKIGALELVTNGEYQKCIGELQVLARREKKDTGNPFFRTLQILAAVKCD